MCCVVLGGLMLFGPRMVWLWRSLRARNGVAASTAVLGEVATSRHLVVSTRVGRAR
ncbi:hypothetical protein NWFMUON74_26550 [Nocardia wallacei]|uniref:Uncharacterized protein n=2 Tax=Nocardia wallacei TaxID=480035 RepID=A0A7G1KKX8_9NOCA|nr:hypothetical protein NWFMUON74_26550 [Nocardia wallacei]